MHFFTGLFKILDIGGGGVQFIDIVMSIDSGLFEIFKKTNFYEKLSVKTANS